MTVLASDIARFRARKHREREEAGQTAAMFLMSGLDLAEALSAPPDERIRLGLRLERLIERERLRGARNHWSYDLNRHIALKQALKRLQSCNGEKAAPTHQARPKLQAIRKPAVGVTIQHARAAES